MPEDYFDRLNLAKVLASAYDERQPDTLQGPPINPANEMSRRLTDSPVGEKAKTFAGALYDAAKLPGDLYSGKHRSYLGLRREDYTDDPNASDPNERLTQGAVSLSDVMSLGGMPMATKGAAGIFGGRLAVTADQQALRRAEELAAAGTSKEKIWNETGWFQGADGKWRFEIPDNKAVIGAKAVEELEKQGSSHGKAAGVLWHDDLFKAYPNLRNIDMAAHTQPAAGGSYMSSAINELRGPDMILAKGPTTKDVRSVGLHELQHGIQQREGWARGSSAEAERNLLSENTGNPIIEQLRSAIATGEYGQPGEKTFMQAARNLLSLEAQSRSERAAAAYRRSAGEVEARNVQSRMDMTPEQRRAAPPWTTEDVSLSQQIVRSDTSGPMASVGGAQKDASSGIDNYAKLLTEAETKAIQSGNRTEFQAVVDQLKSDPSIKVADMQTIARQYGGGAPLEKTKQGALDKIMSRFVDRSYEAAKFRQVDKAKF